LASSAAAPPPPPPPDIVREWVSPLVAEFIGAFALTFAGASAIIMTGGKDLVAIGLAHGLAIGLMVAAAGHISGGAYNPAVCVGLAIGRVIKIDKAVAYIIVELAGAVVAALLVKGVFPSSLAFAPGIHLGTPAVGADYTPGRAFLSEIILSFFLMYVIYGVAVDKRGPSGIAALAIGLTISMDVFANGAVGGAVMNPSRHFGTALVSNDWDNWWIWYTAPVIGMIIAALVYNYVYLARADKS
jgi:MIP family channel proteins